MSVSVYWSSAQGCLVPIEVRPPGEALAQAFEAARKRWPNMDETGFANLVVKEWLAQQYQPETPF